MKQRNLHRYKNKYGFTKFKNDTKETLSITGLLSGAATYSSAVEAERTFNLNPGIAKPTGTSPKSQARAFVLGTAYGEIIKNREFAKINLQK